MKKQQKQQRRTKGTKTSSSSAAANLLSKHGLDPSVVSLGFAAFAAPSSSPNLHHNTTSSNRRNTTSTARPKTTVALPHELAALLRHAIKPSKPTRLRALSNLQTLLTVDIPLSLESKKATSSSTAPAPATTPAPAPAPAPTTSSSSTASVTFSQPQLRTMAQHYVSVFKTLQNDDDRRVREVRFYEEPIPIAKLNIHVCPVEYYVFMTYD